MSDTQKQEALGMSDEDFSSLNLDTAFSDEPETVAEDDTNSGDGGLDIEESEQERDPEAEDTRAAGGEGEGESATDNGEEEETGDADEEEADTDEADAEEEDDADADDSESEDDGEKEEEDKNKDDKDAETEEVKAAKSFFDKVTAPFKANGQQMQIKDADDVVRLMQMGANYNKKMAGLKPALKVVKMLERNKLLDEDRLSFLIDLDKKDPTAIAKLIKDSDLDPMDLDLEEGQKYKSSKNKYSVDDREMALDSVIEDLKDSETYSKTLDLVSNKWDDSSRNIVANEPELMRVIDGHMQNGVYEVISTEVEKERTLGRLNGISDIEAYRQVGDALQANNGFDHLFKQEQAAPTPQKPSKPATPNDAEKRKAKRRAASPSKPAPAPSQNRDFNPLSLSDEEFMKQADNRLL